MGSVGPVDGLAPLTRSTVYYRLQARTVYRAYRLLPFTDSLGSRLPPFTCTTVTVYNRLQVAPFTVDPFTVVSFTVLPFTCATVTVYTCLQ